MRRIATVYAGVLIKPSRAACVGPRTTGDSRRRQRPSAQIVNVSIDDTGGLARLIPLQLDRSIIRRLAASVAQQRQRADVAV